MTQSQKATHSYSTLPIFEITYYLVPYIVVFSYSIVKNGLHQMIYWMFVKWKDTFQSY